MKHIRDLAQLCRPTLGVFAALAGCVTLYALNPVSLPYQYLLTAGVLTCITAAAFAINDYWDIDKDRINHPERPLPSGRISRLQAKRLAVSLFSTALLLAIPLGASPLLLVTVSALLLWYYSPLLKYNGILGNVLVAALVSALILLGALVAGRPLAVLYPMGFLFLFILAKEIVWDVHDAMGDRAQGTVTIANLWGDRVAFQIVWGLLGLLLLSIPGAMVWLPMRYPVWFSIGCLFLLLSFGIALIQYQQQRNSRTYAALIFWARLDMLLGIVGLLGTMPPL